MFDIQGLLITTPFPSENARLLFAFRPVFLLAPVFFLFYTLSDKKQALVKL